MSLPRAFGPMLVLAALMSIAIASVHAQINLNPSCPSGFANFGDSLTDTGNALITFPLSQDAENSPYGEQFFGQPAKRFCNGRLVPDFFSLAFGKPLLDAYFSVASFNYKYGVNFANVGATAALSATAQSPFSLTPFQTGQFIRFQNSVAATQNQFGCINFNLESPSMLFQSPWPSWLYTIVAGNNDILLPLLRGSAPISYVNSTVVPQAVSSIVAAIVTLYQKGARQFLVFGIPAGGCLPAVLTVLGSQNITATDSLGCNIAANSVVQNLNSQLLSQIKLLRIFLPNVGIAFFDYYSAHIEILTHPITYGFNPAVTKVACCGAPGFGTYNYNPVVTCGHPSLGSNNCPYPDLYVSWDGIHFTEAFYRNIAYFALNNRFTDGGVNYAQLCNLDYSKWASGVTFQQAYPFQTCNNLFS